MSWKARRTRRFLVICAGAACAAVAAGLVPTAFARGGAATHGRLGSSAPRIAGAPLVHVETMATVKVNGVDTQGVLLQAYRNIPLPGCPDTVVDALGDSCFYADKSNGHAWVQLVVLQRRDDPNAAGGTGLTYVDNTTLSCTDATAHPQEHAFDFLNGGDVYSNNQNQCLINLVNYVKAHKGDLVIAVNQPGDGTNKAEQPPVGVGAALSGKFINSPFTDHNLGINAAAWFDAPNNGAQLPNAVRGTFSAIGIPGSTDGGISNLASDPSTWDSKGAGRLEADVTVNNENDYVVTEVAPKDVAKNPVSGVLNQAPTPWPTMTAAQAAALSALGNYNPDSGKNAVGLGPDPRAQFYTLNQSDAAWLVTKDHINAVTCTDLASQGCQNATEPPAFTARPRDVVPFTAADLGVAKDALSTEIDDLVRVDSYLQTLASPLVRNSETLDANLTQIQAEIDSETVNKATQKWVTAAFEVINSALDLIPSVGPFLKWGEKAVAVAEMVANAYSTAVSLAEVFGEPAEQSFSVEAATFKSSLAERLVAAQKEITQSWRNIIMADWGKLSKVATCTYPNSDCGDLWHASTFADTNNLEGFYKSALKREAYETLVPIKYPYAMSAGYVTKGRDDGLANNAANFCRPASPYSSDTGIILLPGTGSNANNLYPHFLLTSNTISGLPTDPVPGAASTSVFNHMFGTDYKSGGLSIKPLDFLKQDYINNGHEIFASSYFRFSFCFGGLGRDGWFPG